jgi:putative transcriptional regulator
MDEAPASRRGRLLVASPTLVDPNFHRAVVLMLEHSPDGALGVILNRPSETTAGEALPPPLGDLMAADALVHEGGPVQPEAVILLADFTDPLRAADVAVGSVGIVDPNGDVDGLHEVVGAVRAFGGYAGWSGGQLEQEIAEEAWIDAVCLPEDVFTDEPDLLWSRVLERKGGSWRIIARLPEDPSLN